MENNNFITSGGLAVDDRGTLSYAAMDFFRIKRFYVVENFSTDTIRAFHGHLEEEKYVYVVAGSAIVVVASMNPVVGLGATHRRYVLTARKPEVLHIPAGRMNGFRALESGTKIMFFSTATAEQSREDDYRFPFDKLGESIWTVPSR